ncbi:MAG: ImmA/IrrE family metallo-endopeptidase [Candidatus Moduliflexus flocculans]|nr:ImmA/IrrE family metallo-endopeptidase [Candidatus Moduliflexus flocculans]
MLSYRRRPGVRRHGQASRDTTQEGPRGGQPQPGRVRQGPRAVVGVHLPPRVRQADAQLRDPPQGRRLPQSERLLLLRGQAAGLRAACSTGPRRTSGSARTCSSSRPPATDTSSSRNGPGRRLDLAPQYPASPRSAWPRRSAAAWASATSPSATSWTSCEANGLPRRPPDACPRSRGSPAPSSSTRSARPPSPWSTPTRPPGLQTLVAAHLYGHYLMDRADSPIVDDPDVVVDEYVSLYPPREQFAQTFASRFLVPPAKLRELVEKDLRSKSLSFDDVLFLKRYFGVSTRVHAADPARPGHPAGGQVRGVLQAQSRGPGAGGLRAAWPATRSGARGPCSGNRGPSCPTATACIAAEAAAMDKARGEHPPAPPETGETDE